MIRALWTSASGMEAQQMNLDVIANNLANVNTSGFKKSNIEFQEMMYDTAKSPGASSSDPSTTPSGVPSRLRRETRRDRRRNFTQGNLQQTGNTYDVAIQGQGFYKITLPDGTYAYSRDGSFLVNSDGNLVTNQGYLVTGVGQIDPKATNIAIGSDGTISATVNNAAVKISPITISNFPNPEGLSSLGGNLYQETAASGNAVDGQTPGQTAWARWRRATSKTSNVQVVEEMVNMIQAQRAYEINSKAIQTADQMMGMANGLRQDKRYDEKPSASHRPRRLRRAVAGPCRRPRAARPTTAATDNLTLNDVLKSSQGLTDDDLSAVIASAPSLGNRKPGRGSRSPRSSLLRSSSSRSNGPAPPPASSTGRR